jgi:hypothetical protein
MTRRELLGAFGIAFIAGPAGRIAAGSQDKNKGTAKTTTVTLAISGMT